MQPLFAQRTRRTEYFNIPARKHEMKKPAFRQVRGLSVGEGSFKPWRLVARPMKHLIDEIFPDG
jgi:hypothetical protein